MPQYLQPLPVSSNGIINPSVFVTMDPTVQASVIQASGNNFLIGISQAGPKLFPNGQQALYPGTTPNIQPAAYAGDELEIFTAGDVCGLVVGSGTVNSGDLLSNDGNGNGLTVAPGSGKWFGAVAMTNGNPGEIINVYVTSCAKA